MLPQIFSRGPLSFYINLYNPGECRERRTVKKPEISSEDDIRVLFFHVVLSTVSADKNLPEFVITRAKDPEGGNSKMSR